MSIYKNTQKEINEILDYHRSKYIPLEKNLASSIIEYINIIKKLSEENKDLLKEIADKSFIIAKISREKNEFEQKLIDLKWELYNK